MGHRVGDAVRLREGSELYEVLEPWADLTGRVAGMYDDGERIRVDYPAPFEGYTSAVLAAEFVPHGGRVARHPATALVRTAQ